MLARVLAFRCLGILGLVFLVSFATGCATTGGRALSPQDMQPPVLVLTAGDVLDIKFPGAQTLNDKFKIGTEGFITLPLVGQVQAGGKTAQELQNELQKLYEKELQDKQVIVTLSETANSVYVTGAVQTAGRVPMNRPLTALEAIMEAGGFDSEKANTKKVTVIRYEGEQNMVYHLNLAPIMSGGPVAPFYLRPRDIVHVPAKVQWF
jgi:polysaccharide biosynthesis/export protein